jgi:hypothetical protein
MGNEGMFQSLSFNEVVRTLLLDVRNTVQAFFWEEDLDNDTFEISVSVGIQ